MTPPGAKTKTTDKDKVRDKVLCRVLEGKKDKDKKTKTKCNDASSSKNNDNRL